MNDHVVSVHVLNFGGVSHTIETMELENNAPQAGDVTRHHLSMNSTRVRKTIAKNSTIPSSGTLIPTNRTNTNLPGSARTGAFETGLPSPPSSQAMDVDAARMLISPPPEETLRHGARPFSIHSKGTFSQGQLTPTHSIETMLSNTNPKRKRPLVSSPSTAAFASVSAPLIAETTPNPKPRKQTKRHTPSIPPESPTHARSSIDTQYQQRQHSTPTGLSRKSSSPFKRAPFESPHATNPDADFILPIPAREMKAPSARRRSATPVPAYEPPREQFTPPREVYITPTFANQHRVSKSSKRKVKGKELKVVTVKKELPILDLTGPLPPPSPTDDPLLLSGPPVPPRSSPRLSKTARPSIGVPRKESEASRSYAPNTRITHSRITPPMPSISPEPDDDSIQFEPAMPSTDFSMDDEQQSTLPIFDLRGDDLRQYDDDWSDSGDDHPSFDDSGEYTGRFMLLKVPTKADPPTSGTKERMTRWGRPISPFPKSKPKGSVELRAVKEANGDVDAFRVEEGDFAAPDEAHTYSNNIVHQLGHPASPRHPLVEHIDPKLNAEEKLQDFTQGDGLDDVVEAADGDEAGNIWTLDVENQELLVESHPQPAHPAQEDLPESISPAASPAIERPQPSNNLSSTRKFECLHLCSDSCSHISGDEEGSALGREHPGVASLSDHLSDDLAIGTNGDIGEPDQASTDANFSSVQAEISIQPELKCGYRTTAMAQEKTLGDEDIQDEEFIDRELSADAELDDNCNGKEDILIPSSDHRQAESKAFPLYHDHGSRLQPQRDDTGSVTAKDIFDGEVEDGRDSDTGDPDLIRICSADPRAAARAAAILKMHDYDCLTRFDLKRRNSLPTVNSISHSARRKDLIASGVKKTVRRSSLGVVVGDRVFIPGSPVTTLPQLLQEAEVEVASFQTPSQKIHSSGLVTPIPTRCWNNETGFMSEVKKEWTREDWKQLDTCFTDERLDVARGLGLGENRLADVDQVQVDDVVARFVAFKGGWNSLELLGQDWNADILSTRVHALQRKQRSGNAAPPTPTSTFSMMVPDFTPLRNYSRPLPPSRRSVLKPLSTSPRSTMDAGRKQRNLSPPLHAQRYSHLLEEAQAVGHDFPDSCRKRCAPPSITKRMSGLLFSYLPNIPKAALQVLKNKPLNQTGLPIPPPEILEKPRGPILTPIRPPPERSIPPKDLVTLHPVPIPKPSMIPRVWKPKRLVELQPAPPLQPVIISKSRRSSGGSVKDLIRSFERMEEQGVQQGNLRSARSSGGLNDLFRKTEKPTWRL